MCEDAMTKETYEWKRLLGLQVSEGQSVTAMLGALQQAGRQGAGVVAESLHLICKLVVVACNPRLGRRKQENCYKLKLGLA